MKRPSFIILIFLSINVFGQFKIEWTKRYNGTYNWIDQPIAFKLINNEIIIVGETYDGNHSYDICILKYDENGNELLIKTIDKGNRITHDIAIIDSESFLEVSSKNTDTKLVTKYLYNGDTIWQKELSTTENLKLKITHSSNILVFSTNCSIYQFDSEGNEFFYLNSNSMHDTIYNLQSLILDSEDNIYLTGKAKYHYNPVTQSYEGNDLLLLKYDASGNKLIEKTFCASNYTIGRSITLDNEKNIYITGKQDNGSKRNVLTIKYNSVGDTLWSRLYSSPSESYITGEDIKSTNNGLVYVLAILDWSTDYGLFINLVYDKNGNLSLSKEKRIYSSGGGGASMILENNNYIINCGFEHGYGGGNDLIMFGLDKEGNQMDSLFYNSTNNANESPIIFESDSSGNFYIIASSDTIGNTNRDILTLKISSLETSIVNENIGNNEFKIFPNPLVDISRIEKLKSSPSFCRIKIFDINGTLITIIKANTNNILLNRNEFKPGIYFYEIEENHNYYFGKFIVI